MSDYAVPKVPKIPVWGTYKSKSTGENVKSCQTEEACYDRNLGRLNHNDLNSQILEKQKLQFNYGLKEKHLNRLMIESTKSDKETGEKLAELVERRLDNVVFRSGFARSMPQARQIITQKHIQVNGEIINIASHRISNAQGVAFLSSLSQVDSCEKSTQGGHSFGRSSLMFSESTLKHY